MFDALQSRFQKVFKSLRVQGVLNEEVVDETLREVRLALLDADVNLNVSKSCSTGCASKPWAKRFAPAFRRARK